MRLREFFCTQFNLLLSSSITSSIKMDESVPQAAIHAQAMALPYFTDEVGSALEHGPFLPFFTFSFSLKGLFLSHLSTKLCSWTLLPCLLFFFLSNSNLTFWFLLEMRGLYLAVLLKFSVYGDLWYFHPCLWTLLLMSLLFWAFSSQFLGFVCHQLQESTSGLFSSNSFQTAPFDILCDVCTVLLN